jgi:hypothetical protein
MVSTDVSADTFFIPGSVSCRGVTARFGIKSNKSVALYPELQ